MRDALLADPRLLHDVANETSPDPADAPAEVWRAYIRSNPIAGPMSCAPARAPHPSCSWTMN
ncbi:MAG: hypothetical protein EA387_03400 [Nitriliruptor sp.]|nr:MAG: hypothetical protein EA387_03400 [Nitriliruptor sp.]